MKRKRKNLQQKKPTFAIIVDGETEVWYFQMLKRNEPNLQVNIEPKIPQKKKLSDQFEKVCELAKDYTKVFWIIDFDKIIKETKEVRNGKTTQIQHLKKYLKKLKKYSNVITIINNPCLEFWFLLHFEQTTKYYLKCKGAEKRLKKHITNYEKTQKYFTKQGNDIYKKLKPKLTDAIKNADSTGKIDFENPGKGLSEMNLFFETETIKNIVVD